MILTVYGAMKLEALKNFRLACGQLGLDRIITRTAILDYEFSDGLEMDFSTQFGRGEFIISSMLYAQENSDALLDAVRRLIELGASALAIKTVFFKSLPEAVCALANEERFPIFLFDNTTFFEDVISEISESLKTAEKLNQLSLKLETLMFKDLQREDNKKISMELNRDFRKNIVVFYGKAANHLPALQLDRLYETFQTYKFHSPETLMVGYRDGLMFLISGDFNDPAIFERRLEESLIGCGLSKSALSVGSSGVYDALEGLSSAVREAVWAQMGAEAIYSGNEKERTATAFRDIGIYQLLLPIRDNDWSDHYVNSFLSPLLKKEDETGSELLKTAIAYITCSGQLKQTAEMLFVHENTVRYRINSLHKRLCPASNDLIFYEQLSAAIRLYILKTQNRCL